MIKKITKKKYVLKIYLEKKYYSMELKNLVKMYCAVVYFFGGKQSNCRVERNLRMCDVTSCLVM